MKPCSFVVGDWVLRRILIPQTKLQPNWEGPFEIADVVENGAYRLREIHGHRLREIQARRKTLCFDGHRLFYKVGDS